MNHRDTGTQRKAFNTVQKHKCMQKNKVFRFKFLDSKPKSVYSIFLSASEPQWLQA